jgi:hypothetical protein
LQARFWLKLANPATIRMPVPQAIERAAFHCCGLLACTTSTDKDNKILLFGYCTLQLIIAQNVDMPKSAHSVAKLCSDTRG